MANKLLGQAFSQLDITKKDKDYLIPAILGFLIQGVRTVEVSGRPNYVYARIRGNLNEVVQVFNDKVSPVYNLPVLLIRDPNNPSRYKIDGRDIGRYENWGSLSSYLPKHGNQHSFVPDGGGDIVWVYGQQFVPLLLYPSGTSGADVALINGYSHYDNGTWSYIGGTGTASLMTYKPTGSSSRMVLIYMDSDGNPQEAAGDFFSSSVTGSIPVLPYVPALPAGSIPVGAVRLVSGTSTIGWDNIYDLRPFYDGGGSSSAISTGTVSIYKDGVLVETSARIVDFIGSNVESPSAGRVTVTSPHKGDYIRFWDYSLSKYSYYAATSTGLLTAISLADNSDVLYLPSHVTFYDMEITTPNKSFAIVGDGANRAAQGGPPGASIQNTSGNPVITAGSGAVFLKNLRLYTSASLGSSVVALNSASNYVMLEDVILTALNGSSGSAYAINNGTNTQCLGGCVLYATSNSVVQKFPYSGQPFGHFDVRYPVSISSTSEFNRATIGKSTDYVNISVTGTLSFVGAGAINIPFLTNGTSIPPTNTELNAILGSAGGSSGGRAVFLDVSGSHSNIYLIASDGSANWWYSEMTKAA